jgi:glycosyltransferase involved in cell wall biosynthesis
MTALQGDDGALSPRISVLMTIYNAAPYLRAAIDSLIAQTFPDWELIAIENGSIDGAVDILNSYSDSRIHLHKFESNIGRTPALRVALDNARGEYIAVLDADDVAYPQRFQLQVEFLRTNPEVALVASWAHYIDKGGKIIGEFTPPVAANELRDCLGWTDPFAHSSAMYRRTIALEVGGYPAAFVWGQDFAFFIALTSQHPVAILSEFLCQLRMQDTNMTHAPAYRLIVATERLQLFEMAGNLIALSRRGRFLNRGAVAFNALRLGAANVSEKRFADGFRLIARTLMGNSSYLLTFLVFKLSTGRIAKK